MSADSPYSKSGGPLSVADGATRLQNALKGLEASLRPMADRLQKLEKASGDNEAFSDDRARLARELDTAKANEATLLAREKEFTLLADETMQELDAVISQVRDTLGHGA